jgi:hypothetical protein
MLANLSPPEVAGTFFFFYFMLKVVEEEGLDAGASLLD